MAHQTLSTPAAAPPNWPKRQPYMRRLFDAGYYRGAYPDQVPQDADDEALFAHYCETGRLAQLSPHPDFDEAWYRKVNRDVDDGVAAGSFLSGFHHYALFGRKEGRAGSLRALSLQRDARRGVLTVSELMQAKFDAQWYLENHPEAVAYLRDHKDVSAFDYYTRFGFAQRHSPNELFDERWYLLNNADVELAVREGRLMCGFEHFLLVGAKEGRMPKFDLKRSLDSKYPGLTAPSAIERVRHLEHKLLPPPFFVRQSRGRAQRRRLTFVLPTIDPDIMFGGYIAALHLMRRASERGLALRLLVTEDPRYNLPLALAKLEHRSGIYEAIRDAEVIDLTHRKHLVPVADDDRFICYSAWTGLQAAEMARATSFGRFLFLLQEYEAIFHPNDSQRAIVESVYRLPHIPVFNSTLLRNYFRDNRLGVFGGGQTEPTHFVFEHALASVTPPEAADLDARESRKLLFYARPEDHAARNLFEIGVMALKLAIRRGGFNRHWTFEGIGTLGEKYRIELDEGRILEIKPKIDQGGYESALRGYDAGMSLMFAPHPSVIPFEMASAGLVVVTNTYGTRDAAVLQAISRNIVPADPSVEGIAEALVEAARRAEDSAARIAGSRLKVSKDWNASFGDALLDAIEQELWPD